MRRKIRQTRVDSPEAYIRFVESIHKGQDTMNAGKDSPEVIAFMTKFQELKDWSDDKPDELVDLAADDFTVKDLCVDVQHAAAALGGHEFRAREPYAAPVDPEFRKAWRDYEERYAHLLLNISLMDLVHAGPGRPLDAFDPGSPIGYPERWKAADLLGSTTADNIEAAIDFAEDYADEDRVENEDHLYRIQAGVEDWYRLKNIGFDPSGMFRRRMMFPFVLIPRHVASGHGNEPLSLYGLLQQAHDAFIYGAPYAALALMRSILEKILHDHHGAQAGKLDERIDQALRFGRQKQDLHHIRKLANAILHWDREEGEQEKKFFLGETHEQEMNMILLFLALRALIEEAPKHR